MARFPLPAEEMTRYSCTQGVKLQVHRSRTDEVSMTECDPVSDLRTHDVLNQPLDRGDCDLWASDPALRSFAGCADAQADLLAGYGNTLGQAKLRDAARDANRHGPELQMFDRGGRRLDEIRFHPAYHQFMELSTRSGYSAVAWQGGAGGHATHAAMVYLASQIEPGHCCPLTMTYAAFPVLSTDGDLAEIWATRILARHYDPSIRPVLEKPGVTIGMAMTEKQGGSDVRSNTTRAEADGKAWRLTGYKWFCSAPMSDAFLTLAQAPGGLTCFLVPRWLEDRRNGILIQRLKDKLGNRSNASAEIEYDRAYARQVGEEGRGIQTIIEMVHHTRLDTAMAPVGLMRAALSEAHHWVSHRTAFQKRLIDQPLMRAVLADLMLDWQGALALGMRVASAYDSSTETERGFARIGVALAKFMANKLCPVVVGEAMEILGGMGYVEDTPLPLLYREAPLNGIWEGSGNVICLDALRTLARDPCASQGLDRELDSAAGSDRRYDQALRAHRQRWSALPPEAEARWYVERTALLLTASVLLRQSPGEIAEAFVATRLAEDRGRVPGAIQAADREGILSRFVDHT